MDPARGYEEGLARTEREPVAGVRLVPETVLALIGRGHPVLVQAQVGRGGPDQVEDLLPLHRARKQVEHSLNKDVGQRWLLLQFIIIIIPPLSTAASLVFPP